MPQNIPELSIILPCLNEEKALGACLAKIKNVIKENGLSAEIIVVDNDSADKSYQIALENEAKLLQESIVGYGAACLKGFENANGKYLFLADSDGSYDFNEIPKFVDLLKNGYDFVIGNRFAGKIEKEAMPFLHRYLGRPIFSFLFASFFRAKINDTWCGMRALRKDFLQKLNLHTTGMEFAIEMVIKAVKNKLKIKQVPINYCRRAGKSKLRTLADGWRALRFMLLYTSLFLFLLPGITLLSLGLVSISLLYFGVFKLFGRAFSYHPMFISSAFIIIGYQLIIFAAFTKTYSINRLGEKNKIMNKLYQYISIEKAGAGGILIALAGIIIYGNIFIKWLNSGSVGLEEVKSAVIALTLIMVGAQTIFSSFMLSILGIKEKGEFENEKTG